MSIAANKFRGVRAAMVWDPVVAEMTRLHNDSNVLCLSGDYVAEETAFKILEVWLKTPFEGGRHKVRVDKIKEIECHPEPEGRRISSIKKKK
jgi:ribose 5-phosphate isomerase B